MGNEVFIKTLQTSKIFWRMIVWKLSVCFLHFQWWFQFLEKTLTWCKKVSSIKELPISGDESFVGSIFDLNWTCKKLLIQNLLIWNFNATDLLYISTNLLERYFDNKQNIKKLKFEGEWAMVRPKTSLLS